VSFTDGEQLPLQLRIIGEHQLMNAAACVAVCDVLGLDRKLVISALEALPLAERWRMQLAEVDGIAVINDAYNASPDSMKAALQTLAVLGRQTGRRTVAVLGEMAELGDFSPQEHDSIGRLVVRLNIDQLVVVGEGAKILHMGASQEGSWDGESKFFERIDDALEAVRGMLRSGDIVLVKSSKSANLRKLGDALMGVEE
jgi:UDP-N-acetylmuramoyl-tripeptide--D-alanyl-D-alanine ligase